MDKLTVIRKAEELGNQKELEESGDDSSVLGGKRRGVLRRQTIERLIQHAHGQGCTSEVGGGKIGGINFRYGSIRYAIMDVDVYGNVKLYVQPHPNKAAKADQAARQLKDHLHRYIDENYLRTENGETRSLMKNKKLTCYGHVDAAVEEIPWEILSGFLDRSVECIQDAYYGNTRR